MLHYCNGVLIPLCSINLCKTLFRREFAFVPLYFIGFIKLNMSK